ncbi:MAG: nitroreductase/dihydropteridine reductase [Parvicellaceae bacterium]|jgi:nitroreductase/dihydropteridine reductase
MEFIENLKWRYATKQYDSSKKVKEEDLDKIKEAIQLSASSYGLQLFKVLNIENKSIREKLKPVSWGQSPITDSSHLLVLCNYTEVQNENIDGYLNLKAEVQGIDVVNLKGYGDFIKSKLKEKSSEEKSSWTAKQTYLALANVLNACAELKIDSTPMEGFEPDKYNEILGLKKRGLEASVVIAIGYRSKEDTSQNAKKVRKPLEVLFEEV